VTIAEPVGCELAAVSWTTYLGSPTRARTQRWLPSVLP